jgi:hypothetical protein
MTQVTDPPQDNAQVPEWLDLLHCKSGEIYGRARAEEQGFTVLAGARGVLAREGSALALQRSLIERGVVQVEGERLRFLQDERFSFQKQAAMALMGRESSGFFVWRRANGLTFGQINRFIHDADEPSTHHAPA